MKFNPDTHHRHSIRLKDYDYTQAGAYFVTICAWRQECIFGEIVAGEIRLSPLGNLLYEEWFRSANIRKEIRLHEDEFVIMPNHLHGIVWIVGADGIRPGTTPAPPPVGADGIRPGVVPRDDGDGASLAPLQRAPRSLSSFVAGFKASVTSRARRELYMPGIWQRNFYEHIIRNDADLQRIEAYIRTNPQRWEQDQLHPLASPNKFNRDR
jgi:REP element-mobilizing transposase RayT